MNLKRIFPQKSGLLLFDFDTKYVQRRLLVFVLCCKIFCLHYFSYCWFILQIIRDLFCSNRHCQRIGEFGLPFSFELKIVMLEQETTVLVILATLHT